MSNTTTSPLSALWQAHQANDSQAGLRAVASVGFNNENSELAFGALSRMASEAVDFGHFTKMFSGESPMKTKLSVAEAASLQMAQAESRGNWYGNGGRTWEGSSSR